MKKTTQFLKPYVKTMTVIKILTLNELPFSLLNENKNKIIQYIYNCF